MKGRPPVTPNLNDILARDFAELKAGERPAEPTRLQQPATLGQEAQAEVDIVSSKPKVYNQVINAVEERESFGVKAPKAEGGSQNESESQNNKPNNVIVKEATSKLGDDFDVEW